MARARSDAGLAVRGGIAGGLVGWLALTAFLLLLAATQGADGWQTLKTAAAPLLGDRALAPGFDAAAVILGVACSVAVSLVWGVLFGLIFFGISRTATIVGGAFWGVIVWLAMYYVVLPIVGRSALASGAPVGLAVISHLLFGIAVALGFLPYQRELPIGERNLFARRIERPPPDE